MSSSTDSGVLSVDWTVPDGSSWAQFHRYWVAGQMEYGFIHLKYMHYANCVRVRLVASESILARVFPSGTALYLRRCRQMSREFPAIVHTAHTHRHTHTRARPPIILHALLPSYSTTVHCQTRARNRIVPLRYTHHRTPPAPCNVCLLPTFGINFLTLGRIDSRQTPMPVCGAASLFCVVTSRTLCSRRFTPTLHWSG